MFGSPLPQGHDGDFVEGDCFALAFPGDGRPALIVQRPPEAFGLAIEDQEDVLVDVAANAESIDLAVFFASVNHGQFGERSPTDQNGLTGQGIVDQFMVVQQSDGIGPGVAVEDVADNLELFDGRVAAGPSADEAGVIG